MQENKPYIWLDFVDSTSCRVEFTVSLGNNKTIPVNPTTITDNDAQYRRTVTYQISGAAGTGVVERTYTPDALYDPTRHPYLTVKIVDSSGTEKGKGTVDHDEADSSGGGGYTRI